MGMGDHAQDVFGFCPPYTRVWKHLVHGSETHALEQVGSSASDDGTDRWLQGSAAALADRREAAFMALSSKQLNGY